MEILFLMCGYCSVDVFRRFYGQVNILMAAAEMWWGDLLRCKCTRQINCLCLIYKNTYMKREVNLKA